MMRLSSNAAGLAHRRAAFHPFDLARQAVAMQVTAAQDGRPQGPESVGWGQMRLAGEIPVDEQDLHR
ncbi:hypothetical protein [Paracoccus sp. S3-43]|uniref:hypothetical protein n=1 Tax=Paracoccus sp. S3-43 TaxID=3030011 RepID=UPI0023AE79D0|nr:hypothetical protein [Paracoccus sp. S3-43]WEF25375.1 hypothetical protein PXD02_05410 [Paracoccus sp. S3-43]